MTDLKPEQAWIVYNYGIPVFPTCARTKAQSICAWLQGRKMEVWKRRDDGSRMEKLVE